jgi:hypothetical protein
MWPSPKVRSAWLACYGVADASLPSRSFLRSDSIVKAAAVRQSRGPVFHMLARISASVIAEVLTSACLTILA